MQNSQRCFIAIVGLVFSTVVFAESASDSLTRIEEETLVLTARQKQLDVQAKIIERQNEISAKQADADNRLAHSAIVGNPLVQSVEGIGNNIYATLQLDSGRVIDVQIGDVLPNGMKIVSIRSNVVIVELGNKKRARLDLASDTQFVSKSSSSNFGLSSPLPPPMQMQGQMPIPGPIAAFKGGEK